MSDDDSVWGQRRARTGRLAKAASSAIKKAMSTPPLPHEGKTVIGFGRVVGSSAVGLFSWDLERLYITTNGQLYTMVEWANVLEVTVDGESTSRSATQGSMRTKSDRSHPLSGSGKSRSKIATTTQTQAFAHLIITATTHEIVIRFEQDPMVIRTYISPAAAHVRRLNEMK